MRIPGEILKKYVRFEDPQLNGFYVCWICPEQRPAMSSVPISPVKIKKFKNGEWIEKEQVLGWIGPLPVYSLDELQNEQEQADVICYAIGTKESIKTESFKAGPFNQSIETMFIEGQPGDYVFELHPVSKPKVIHEWSKKENRWLKFKGGDLIGTSPSKNFKRRKKGRKKAEITDKKDTGKCYWYKGTKKQAANGFKGCEKDEVPMIGTKGKIKGEIIWNFNPFWDNPFPEFIWNGKAWDVLSPAQTEKIKTVTKRMKMKYKNTKEK